MGGDGGVIASNRRYLRGAGSACHTADRARIKKTQEDEHQECREIMRNCALTGETLRFLPDPDLDPNPSDTSNQGKSDGNAGSSSCTSDSSIVVCPYGKLYIREAAIEALLRRKQQETSGTATSNNHDREDTYSSGLGSHIRGLKDLHSVRFQLLLIKNSNKEEYIPICPITGDELNGQQPAIVIIRPKSKQTKQEHYVNVLSDRAIKEMGISALQAEYGPFQEEHMIRLAPHYRELERIKEQVRITREEQLKVKERKKQKKITSKRNLGVTNAKVQSSSTSSKPLRKKSKITSTVASSDAVAMARMNVASAVASDSALSSLFTNKKKALSEKDKKDNLFVR